MKKQSPVQRIWELGRDEHGRLITAVVMAVAGVVCGMAPYFAAARIIVLLLAGETALEAYTPWLAAALCGYLLRTALYNGALSLSHKATFSILKTIRRLLMAKLPRLPLGTVMDTSSGKLKQIIVDQVDSIRRLLPHRSRCSPAEGALRRTARSRPRRRAPAAVPGFRRGRSCPPPSRTRPGRGSFQSPPPPRVPRRLFCSSARWLCPADARRATPRRRPAGRSRPCRTAPKRSPPPRPPAFRRSACRSCQRR